jgi:hypothetical protein
LTAYCRRKSTPVTQVSIVTLQPGCLSNRLLMMQVSRTHIGIALGVGCLVVVAFFGLLVWLNNQPPVLARSEQRDPLTKMPLSITMNPLRDRTLERNANAFITEMRDGNCRQLLAAWEKDYRKKRANFICDSETQHPLISWNLVEWEETPPLLILHYRGQRYSSPKLEATYKDLLSVTLENRGGAWSVTKYDAFY